MARAPADQTVPQDPSSAKLRSGTRIGAVVSTFHRELTGAMLASARRELVSRGLAEQDLLVLEVPGAFELPLVARRLAVRDDVHAVLCLGLVLRGETPHDRYISYATALGIQQVSLETDKPVLFGVLTCNDLAQARARALAPEDGGDQDKGREVARAAVEALSAMEQAPTLGLAQGGFGFLRGDAEAAP